jgi:hypothetical protein
VVAAGETLSVPLVASVPAQPPLAVQEAALALDQVSVEEPPMSMVVGLTERVAVGAVAEETVTVVLEGAPVPPAPVQVSV